MRTCNLDAAHDLTVYREIIVRYVAENRRVPWITGGGWYGDVFDGGIPTAAELDRLTDGRPAYLKSHDCHGAWVNSAALRLAGIDRETPDPAGGRIVRDDRGEATGVLMDAAVKLVADLIPAPTFDDHVDAMRTGVDHLAGFGITALHDALVGSYGIFDDALPVYEALGPDGLPLRVSGSIWWPLGVGLEALDEVLSRRERMVAAGFHCDSVKIMQDGICENLTAALLAPYAQSDAGHGHSGDSTFEPLTLARIVTELDRRGLRVHFHGVGDRAVRECLDAVLSARTANGTGPRHQVAHVDLVHPDDLARFAQLDVAANIQPLWARADTEILERKLPLMRDEQRSTHFTFASLAAAGAPLAIGSDWPVSSPNPLWAIHAAVTRTAPGGDVHARNPESRVVMDPGERLSLRQAVDAYTIGAAEVQGRGQELGRIREGFCADLVVLDRNIEDDAALADVSARTSVVAGELVLQGPGSGS